MKYGWIFLLVLGLPPAAAAQQAKAGYGETVTQTQPEFPGGRDSLTAYIRRHLHYPKNSLAEGIRGKVWLGFTVDTAGALRDASVLKSVNEEMDAEALKMLEHMPPWRPATAGGTPVEAQYILQVEFIPPGQPVR